MFCHEKDPSFFVFDFVALRELHIIIWIFRTYVVIGEDFFEFWDPSRQ